MDFNTFSTYGTGSQEEKRKSSSTGCLGKAGGIIFMVSRYKELGRVITLLMEAVAGHSRLDTWGSFTSN